MAGSAMAPVALQLPRPVAFAFSGGASLGALQVGYMRALMEVGVVPDMLVGVSAGALNAAWMGQGWTSENLAALAEFWIDLRFHDVFGHFPLWGALSLPLGSPSLVSNRHLAALAEQYLPEDHDSLVVDTILVAADLQSGRPVQLRSGNLRRNALASGALPGVFPPVEIDGQVLVDGGVAENVPMNQAALLGANTIVVLDASYPCELEELPEGVIGRTMLVISHTLSSQAVGTLALVPGDRTVVYLPGPCPLRGAPGDFTRGRKLIEQGHASARPFLETLVVGGSGIYGDPRFYARTPIPRPGTREALHRGPMHRVRTPELPDLPHHDDEATLAEEQPVSERPAPRSGRDA